jgi:amino acid adenylation domain-containing protein
MRRGSVMSAIKTILKAKEQGVELYLQEGKLAFKARNIKLSDQLRSEIGQYKAQIIEILGKQILTHTQPSISPYQGNEKLLSFSQQRLWLINQMESNSSQYNMTMGLDIQGELKIDYLQSAFDIIVKRHQILRTVYKSSDDGLCVTQVEDSQSVLISIFDLTQFDEKQGKDELESLTESEVFKPFDLSKDLMIRVNLIQLSNSCYRLLIVVHHIAFDGLSIGVVVNELLTLYRFLVESKPAILQELPIQYSDYANWQRNWLKGEVLTKHLEYWKKELAGIPLVHELPLVNHCRPAEQSYQGSNLYQKLPLTLFSQLNKLAKDNQVTLFMLLNAAFASLIARLSNESCIVIGTPIANREQIELKNMVGYFANTLILRTDFSADPTFTSLLLQCKNCLLNAYEHQEMPFDKLVEELKPERSLSFNPLFQIMLTLQNYHKEELSLPDVNIDPVLLSSNRVKSDLCLDVCEEKDALLLNWEFASDLFDLKMIERMSDSFSCLLTDIINHPGKKISELAILPEKEQYYLLNELNNTKADYPREKCIHELIEAQVEQTPDSIAVVFEDESLTYSELNAKANQLAHYLIEERLVTPDTLVGICVDRSLDMIVGIMAIIKAGGAYVPLDPEYPESRLKYMLEDAQLDTVLTKSCVEGKVPVTTEQGVCLDDEIVLKKLAQYSTKNINPSDLGLASSHLAYVIYTSGSTGNPKGVMIEHTSLTNLAILLGKEYQLSNRDCFLQFATINFDMSVEDVFGALCAGCQLVLRSDSWLQSPEVFWQKCLTYKVTVLDLPTAFWHELVKDANQRPPQCVRHISIGGEKVDMLAVKSWYRDNGHSVRLLNTYGPTECTVDSTFCDIVDGETSIGRAIDNYVVYVLNDNRGGAGIGVAGELHIGGVGLARGYLNQPELTAEKFISNPFYDASNPNSSERLYKTGDLCRILSDGNIEYIGRIDHQVKIRGFRIELGEIEHALGLFDEVTDVIVLARESDSGDNSLVAYVVTDRGSEFAAGDEDSIKLRHGFVETLRVNLKQSLPDFMVPSAFVVLDKLPLTPNGKIDRKALPSPTMSLQQKSYDSPSTETEKLLCEIWQEVLGLEQVGIADNFFELGGHSLLVMTVIAKAQKAGLSINGKSLFSSPTLADLAQHSDAAQVEATPIFKAPDNLIPVGCEHITPDMLPLVSLTQANITQLASKVPGGVSNIQDIYPLGPLQTGIFYTHMMSEDSDPYVMLPLYRLKGEAAVSSFLEGLQFIINRHDVLRTAIFWHDLETPVQVVCREATLPVSWLTLDENQSIQTQMEALTAPEKQWIELSQAPILNVKVAKDNESEQYFVLLQYHHIISDHVGMEIIEKELAAYGKGDAALLPSTVPYREFIAHAQHQAEHHDAEKFFTELLNDIDEPTTPFNLVDVQGDGTRIIELKEMVPGAVSCELRALSKSLKISPASLFHSAWAMVVGACSGRDDVVFGTVMSGRLQGTAGSAHMLGVIINTLPVRIDLTNTSTRDFVLTTQQTLHDLIPYEQTSLALAQGCSALANNTPIFSAMLNYRHSAPELIDEPTEDSVEASNSSVLEFVQGQERTNYPFMLTVDNLGVDFELELQIDLSVDVKRVMLYMQTALAQLVKSLMSTPEQLVHQLSVLPESEIHQQLVQWNDTTADYSTDKCIHELFEAQVEQTPDAIAVIFEDDALTYSELNAKANQLAHYLVEEKQITPDTLVGLCVERSLDMIVGIMAILKAGGAYVPLDPDYPQARLEYMLEDARLDTVLTQSQLADKVPVTTEQAVYLNDELILDRLAQYSTSNINLNESGLTAHHLAYVIYTSGSTGQPKGVLTGHKSVTSLVINNNFVELNDKTVILVNAPIAFDASTFEIWGGLLNGGKLVIQGELRVDIVHLGDFINKNEITVAWMTSGLFDLFSSLYKRKLPSLTNFLVGGDVVNKHAVSNVRKLNPGLNITNGYGPTENTVFSCCYPIPENVERLCSIPVGKPLSNRGAFILNQMLHVLPLGVAGELHVSGEGLARGYLNHPALTAEKFITNPFSDESDAKLYKTGDLCRYLPDGNIEFIGRLDNQVKIRGFRIELGEIESALSAFDEVNDRVVVARETNSGDKSLVAYIVTDKAGEFTGEDESSIHLCHEFIERLRQGLNQSLPDYMVPSAFVVLDKLPLTPNGKIDRKALPALDMSLKQAVYVAPTSDTEKVLCEIWQAVLGLEQVGITDNFFELGGHSLLVMTVIAKAQTAGLSINAKSLFVSPTLAELAQHLDATQAEAVPVFKAPDNLIPVGCEHITPQMLPLVSLTQANIEQLVTKIPGGARNIQDIYPLGPLQSGILYTHMMSEGPDPYVLPTLFRINSEGAVSSFIDGLQFIINRHDVLRTAVFWGDLETPVQVVCREARLPVSWLTLDENQSSQTQMEALTTPEQQWMELSQAPLLQVKIARDNESEQHFVLLQFHHLISDHVGLDVIQKELAAYNNGDAALLPQTVPYREFIAHTQHQAEHHDAEIFFTKRLGDIDEPTTPFNLVDVQGDGSRIIELTEVVPPAVSCELRGLSKSLKVSPASLFHSAWAMVVGACSGRDDVVFGTVMSGRLQGTIGSEYMLGVFINTLPVRIDLTNTSTRDLVLTTQQALHDLLPYEQTSLVLAQGCSGLANNAPLFSAMLNYRHSAPELIEEPSVEARNASPIESLQGQERTNYPFNLNVDDLGVDFELNLQIDLSVDVKRVMLYMQTALAQLVKSLVSNHESPPEQLVHKLSVLPASEIHQQLVQLNDIAANSPSDKCIHERFEAQVEQSPDAIAVVFEDDALTYSELNAKANQLAHYLVDEGVKPDTLVGLCVERSLEMVIGIMGILKAGGAYVPLDPDCPQSRLDYILSDSQPQLLLTSASIALQFVHSDVPCLALDSVALDAYEMSTLKITGFSSKNLAYVIYTSGSTGQPKGVLQTHENVVRLFSATEDNFNFVTDDVWVLFHSIAFDFSVWELWGALFNGSKLIIPDFESTRNFEKFVELCATEKVSVLNQTPTAFLAFSQQVLECKLTLPDLRYVVFGGEALQSENLQSWWSVFNDKQPQLINMYGITETTVHVSFKALYRNQDNDSSIGKRLSDQSIYLLNKQLQPVPFGCEGEIYIGGAGLARGYLNQTELTNERFIDNPYASEIMRVNGYTKMYKTGDLARYTADTELVYLGRNDDQVKVSGFRIELPEIERQLTQLSDVDSCVVLAEDFTGKGKQLVGYVRLTQDSQINELTHVLRNKLLAILPAYMVPSVFVLIKNWPLTPNGKVDKKALPTLDMASAQAHFVAAKTEMEQELVTICSELFNLPVDNISTSANFFELGGNSLLSTRLIAKIRARLSVEVSIREIFAAATLADIARKIASTDSATIDKPVIIVSADDKNIPLSFAQKRFWTLDQIESGSTNYNIPTVLKACGTLDIAALQYSLDSVALRHQILTTNYTNVQGEPQAVLRNTQTVEIGITDLCALDDEEQTERLQEALSDELAKPFDLVIDLMFRVSLIKLKGSEHIILFTLHHIAADGHSMEILVREISTLYNDYLPNCNQAKLPKHQYRDFALWQQSKDTSMQLDYWQNYLRGIPEVCSLPLDYERPVKPKNTGQVLQYHMSADVLAKLKKLAIEQECTLFILLQNLFALFIARWTDHPEVVIGSPVSGRTHEEFEDLIGCFLNTLVFRFNFSPEQTLADILSVGKKNALDAFSNQDIPFEQLVKKLVNSRSGNYNPLFQIWFVLQDNKEQPLTLNDLSVEQLDASNGSSQFDLQLSVSEVDTGVALSWTFNDELFNRNTIEQMATSFETLVERILMDKNQRVYEISLLSEQNSLTHEKPEKLGNEVSPTQKIAQFSEMSPEKPAFYLSDEVVSYKVLNDNINKFIQYLIIDDIDKVDVVGIYAGASLSKFTLILALQRLGKVYLEFPHSATTSQIQHLIAEHKVTKVFAEPALLPESVVSSETNELLDELFIDLESAYLTSLTNQTLTHNLALGARKEHYRYLILNDEEICSIPEKTVNTAISQLISLAGTSNNSRVLQSNYQTAASDIHWMSGLAAGACIYPLVRDKEDLHGKQDEFIHEHFIREHNITQVILTQGHLSLLSAEQAKSLDALIVNGGLVQSQEMIHRSEICDLIQVTDLPGAPLAIIDRVLPVQSIALGKPCEAYSANVYDQAFNQVPPGSVGELYFKDENAVLLPEISSDTSSKINFSVKQDALTQHKTGLMVRRLMDGRLEVRGKLNEPSMEYGFSLLQVEQFICVSNGVKQSMLVFDTTGNVPQVVAYVVPLDEKAPHDDKTSEKSLANKLLQALMLRLPQKLAKPDVVIVSALPLTVTGEWDRAYFVTQENNWSNYLTKQSHTNPVVCIEDSMQESQIQRISSETDELLVKSLSELVQKTKCSEQAIIVTALTILLRQNFGHDNSPIGLFSENMTPTTDQLQALNTVKVSNSKQSDTSSIEAMINTCDVVYSVGKSTGVPVNRLMDKMEALKADKYSSLFAALVHFQTGGETDIQWQADVDFFMRDKQMYTGLLLSVKHCPDSLSISWQFNEKLHNRQSVVSLAKQFRELIVIMAQKSTLLIPEATKLLTSNALDKLREKKKKFKPVRMN